MDLNSWRNALRGYVNKVQESVNNFNLANRKNLASRTSKCLDCCRGFTELYQEIGREHTHKVHPIKLISSISS